MHFRSSGMIGVIKSILHEKYHVSENDLITVTDSISDDNLKNYLNKKVKK